MEINGFDAGGLDIHSWTNNEFEEPNDHHIYWPLKRVKDYVEDDKSKRKKYVQQINFTASRKNTQSKQTIHLAQLTALEWEYVKPNIDEV